MAKLSVIIPAAGSGKRMGTKTPKPFLKLRGKPILQHTLANFVDLPQVSQIIIVTNRESFSRVEVICESFSKGKDFFVIVQGGGERQQSILKGLQRVGIKVELVAVHDAVRPFIKRSVINKACDTAEKVGAAVVGIPTRDTIKKVDRDYTIRSTPDRSTLWQAQTPQIFRKDLIKKAYTEASEQNFIGTDDASLVERMGAKVQMVESDSENFKITYPLDLKLAELIMGEDHE